MENQSVPGQLDLLSMSGYQPAPPSPPQEVDAGREDGVFAEAVHQDAVAAETHQEPMPQPSGALRTLLILDTETTGLDPETDQCLEVGAILFDVPSRQVLAQVSFLLPVEHNGAEAINRIPAAVTTVPQPWKEALGYFQTLLAAADVIVAHNAAFDRQWFGLGPLPSTSKPWLCSMEDMRWPQERQLRARPSVRDLALAYEIPVWAAHRALTDCIYLAEVFRRCEDLELILAQGMEPRLLYKAQVSYDQRHLAREAGFRWNDPVPGAWTRRLSAREAEALSFAVQSLEEDLPMAS